MDKTLFYISLFMLTIGIAGQLAWYFFGGIPCNPPGGHPYLFGSACDPTATAASFQEMENISGYIMIIGFILLPAGLFKDGLPSPGYGSKVLIGVILVLVLSVSITGALLAPTASSSKGPTPDGFISILKGSATPGTLITYSPQNVTLVIGENNTVEWTNNDIAAHTVTSVSVPAGAPTFNSGNMNPGAKYVHEFTTPGTYTYHCSYHFWMQGTITVVQS